MHEEINDSISNTNDILPTSIIRELKSSYVRDWSNQESKKKINNQYAVVLYQEPVNMLLKLTIELVSEDGMEVE